MHHLFSSSITCEYMNDRDSWHGAIYFLYFIICFIFFYVFIKKKQKLLFENEKHESKVLRCGKETLFLKLLLRTEKVSPLASTATAACVF